VNEQNATMDKIILVVHRNHDIDPIRFRAKVAIFNFESNIVTTLLLKIVFLATVITSIRFFY